MNERLLRITLSFVSPGQIKRREVELDSHEEFRLSFADPGEIKRRKVVLDPQESPGEIKSRDVELGSESWTYLLLHLFLNSSATDIVFVSAPHSS